MEHSDLDSAKKIAVRSSLMYFGQLSFEANMHANNTYKVHDALVPVKYGFEREGIQESCEKRECGIGSHETLSILKQ